MAEALNLSLFKNRALADVTFLFDGHKVKAHKCVLYDRCGYFKQLFDDNNCDVINMDGSSFKLFKEVVKFCYLQQIDLADWTYDDKQSLYELATKYNYDQLMKFVKRELVKRPEVPLSVDTLNEWYENSPADELREWIKYNLLNIFNYEYCFKYTEGLIYFILDTYNKMEDEERNKYQIQIEQKKLFPWLFRWRNWSNRNEDDVHSLFSELEFDFMSDERPSCEAFRKNLSLAVRHFMRFREVKTDGWKRDEVLELLCFAHDLNFGQLLDAVLHVVTTQHLDPVSLKKIHHLTSELEDNKLQKAVVDYIKNQTMTILTSAEFTNYPASLVGFMLQKLSGQIMDVNVKNQLLSSLWKWKTSKSVDELKAVLTKIQWEDFSLQQLAAVLRILIPTTCLAYKSGPLATAECKGTKRKLSDNSQRRRGVRPRKD